MEQYVPMWKRFQTSGISFAQALQLSSELLCFDRRDSVYDLRAMVDWPHDMEAPQPDYKISPTDLFWVMVPMLLLRDTEWVDRAVRNTDRNLLCEIDPNSRPNELREMSATAVSCDLLWRALHRLDVSEGAASEVPRSASHFGERKHMLPNEMAAVVCSYTDNLRRFCTMRVALGDRGPSRARKTTVSRCSWSCGGGACRNATLRGCPRRCVLVSPIART
jgi:hypothetical protein